MDTNTTSLMEGTRVRTLAELEKNAIENAVALHRGNLTKAAQALGIGRATIYRKIREYGIRTQV